MTLDNQDKAMANKFDLFKNNNTFDFEQHKLQHLGTNMMFTT
jgi:hypothetical protein